MGVGEVLVEAESKRTARLWNVERDIRRLPHREQTSIVGPIRQNLDRKPGLDLNMHRSRV